MKYTFKPEGVCSIQMNVELEDDILKSVDIVGGCPGNTVGITKLVQGRKIDEVISLLKGIPCRTKGTSCPDQLAIGLEKIKREISK